MKTVTSAESPRVSKAKFIEALTLSGNAHVKSLCLKMPCRGFLFNAQGVISEIEREFLERLLKALQANLSEVKHRLSIGEVFVSHPFKNSIGGLYGVNIDKRQSGLYEAQRTLKRACKGCEWQLSKPNNDGINRTALDKVVDKIALQLQKNHQKGIAL